MHKDIYKSLVKTKQMRYKLKDSIIEMIRHDSELYGLVAKSLGVKGSSFIQTLRLKTSKLTEIGALKILSNYLGIPQDELIEPIEESETV